MKENRIGIVSPDEFYQQPRLPLGNLIKKGGLVVGLGIASIFVPSVCLNIIDSRQAAAWTDDMKGKLADPTTLSPDERFYERVTVFPAGRDLDEASRMGSEYPWVNVRNRPYGEVIGRVLVGSEVFNVIVNRKVGGGWGTAKCEDIKGLVPKNPVKPLPEICAIHYDYLKQ